MAANRPLPSPLPADLPEDWQDNQIVAPEGADVGLTEQHGYNYLMQQVNDAQRAANQLKEDQGTVDENLQQLQESLEKIQTALNGKQDELSGTKGQVVGFDEEGHAVAQEPDVGRSMAGQTVEPTQGTAVTAGESAEVFNDYRSRTFLSDKPWQGNVASGAYSHAEGFGTTASGDYSHAEGMKTEASGLRAHAEGERTHATGTTAHAEGVNTIASGSYAHAEGGDSIASGSSAHAEGHKTQAKGNDSHAAGFFTIANDYQYVVGTYNVEKPGGVYNDRFIVGGGWNTTMSNAFRVNYNGNCYGSGSWNTSGADYAELFEWQDGNLDAEDRAGLFVTLDGEYIRIATPEDDYILGIVSASPSVVGDVYDDQWAGMYLRDVFGRTIIEEQDFPADTREVPGENGEMETIEICPAFRASAPVVNPEYNQSEPYQPRTQRPEWDAVGLLGKLVAVDDGTCQVNGWATVGVGGVATASLEQTKYRIMARLDDTHVKVMIL